MYFVYHQAVSAGFQGAEADAEQDRCGECVVVDEAAALGVTMVTVQGQIRIGVAGEQNRAEVDLQGDGLHAAVHADVPLSFITRQWSVKTSVSVRISYCPAGCLTRHQPTHETLLCSTNRCKAESCWVQWLICVRHLLSDHQHLLKTFKCVRDNYQSS